MILRTAATLFGSSGVEGAACVGAPPFSDVSAAATYCTNTEWLANRGITLGCTATTYCPNDPVTRASMALFMNRLADALIEPPVRIENNLGAFNLTALAINNVVCEANVLLAAGYPRSISMSTHVTMTSPNGFAAMGIQPLYSTDLGATWSFPNTYAQFVTFDSVYSGNASVPTTFTLPAGMPLRVGVGTFTNGGATLMASGGRCHVLVQVQSRSGSASPFDQPVPDAGRAPDGS